MWVGWKRHLTECCEARRTLTSRLPICVHSCAISASTSVFEAATISLPAAMCWRFSTCNLAEAKRNRTKSNRSAACLFPTGWEAMPRAQAPRPTAKTRRAAQTLRANMPSVQYEIVLYWSKEDQAFIAEVPELPGCAADGATYQDALANVEVVIREWIETAQELGRSIPEPRGRLMYA